jgi:hypothetical protein
MRPSEERQLKHPLAPRKPCSRATAATNEYLFTTRLHEAECVYEVESMRQSSHPLSSMLPVKIWNHVALLIISSRSDASPGFFISLYVFLIQPELCGMTLHSTRLRCGCGEEELLT